MRPKRRILLIALVIALAAIVTVLLWPRERQPTYRGKSLSRWLLAYQKAATPDAGYASIQQSNQAIQAVRTIGTNAVPVLLAWLDYKIPPWRLKVLQAYYRHLAPRVGLSDAISRSIEGSQEARSELAVVGFEILGSEAQQAIPELARRLNVGDSRAGIALGLIGPQAVASLLSVLNDPKSENRRNAVVALGTLTHLGTNAATVAAALVYHLRDPDRSLARSAARALGHLAVAPDLALPALTNSLNNGDSSLRYAALFGIAGYKDAGRPALPALTLALDDPDELIRTEATNAINAIAPEVLRQSKLK